MKHKRLKSHRDEFKDVTALIYPDLLTALERDDIKEMDVPERKRRLSRFARENIYTPGGSPHRMSALQSIMELNKMDGSYAPQRHQHQHVVFEVVLVDRTKKGEDDNAIKQEEKQRENEIIEGCAT